MTLLPPIPYPHLNLKPHPKQPFALPTTTTTTTTTAAATPTALIVGGGLAGLAAAVHLHSSNTPFLLLEASDAVGGRVRTDRLDGFLLDRGFQIFLTAYPEARRLLHYPSLSLRPFYPGALVYTGGGRTAFHRVADPFRRPLDGLASLANPIGTLPDKLLTGLARLLASARSDADILSADESTIAHRLRSSGFSPSIVDRFFAPFLSGIFFDPDLHTTSRLFDFVIKCLALGDNVLPAAGIGAIPDHLAARLPGESVRLNSRVAELGFGSSVAPTVRLESGDVLAAELGLVVAVDQPEAERLLPQLAAATSSSDNKPAVRSTVCIYFSADRAAVEDPILILNGSGQGIVNNMFFATNVAPSYGPDGKVLVSVSLVGDYDAWSDDDLIAEVVRELGGWFGDREVGSWRHLRTYRIGFAQPDQTPPTDLIGKDPRVGDGVYVCGDYRSSATFDGALVSGRRAAEALIEDRALLH